MGGWMGEREEGAFAKQHEVRVEWSASVREGGLEGGEVVSGVGWLD